MVEARVILAGSHHLVFAIAVKIADGTIVWRISPRRFESDTEVLLGGRIRGNAEGGTRIAFFPFDDGPYRVRGRFREIGNGIFAAHRFDDRNRNQFGPEAIPIRFSFGFTKSPTKSPHAGN